MLDSVPSSMQDGAILLLAYLLSVFFAVVKIVLFSLDRNSIAPDRERLRYYATQIEALQERRPVFDGVVTFGRLLASSAFALYSYVLCTDIYPALSDLQSVLVSLAFSVVVLGLCAHAIPRAFAKRYYEGLAPTTLVFYRAISWVLLPFVVVMNGVHILLLKAMRYDERLAFLSAEDQSRIHHDGENGDEGLDEEEKEMIRSIFELGDTTVEEIMVPRIDIKAVEEGTDLPTVLKVVREGGHSRLPVYADTVDSVTGILYVKDVLSWMSEHQEQDWDLASVTKKPYFVPAGKKVDDMMTDFKAKHLHIAVVVDEYGGTAGIVTMEDILEEIVGDIQDEYDHEERPVVAVAEHVYHVDPHIDLHDLGEEINVDFDLDDVEYNTLGGLIYHEFGDVPHTGAVVEHDGLHLKVLEMDRQRIERVEVSVRRDTSEPDVSF